MRTTEGKIIRVDLSTRAIEVQPSQKYSEWIGGQGVNQYILFNELPLGIAAYDPINILAIGAGALVGTTAPGACRVNIDSLNPYTDGIGSSNAGGYFGKELRCAGFDNIVIRGKAKHLSYLRIEDGNVDIVEADDLKNRTISETTDLLQKELGDDYRLMLIGPAGENIVRPACVILDGARAAGRCGMGAVMGSKNLKAIAVKGTGTVEPAHPKHFEARVRECFTKVRESSFARLASRFGIHRQEPWEFESPYRNFSGNVPTPESKQKVLPDAFLQYLVGGKACSACPIPCWKVYEIPNEDKTIRVEGLQINSIHNFGAKLDLFDPKAILRAHHLCNDLGLDEDNTCGTLAWAFECYERGLIGKTVTDGLELEWGNEEAVLRLIEKMAFRKGFGHYLAEGCLRASDHFPGTRDACVHIKGQDLFEVMWACPAWALGVAVAARGGTHTRGAVKTERFKGMSKSLCQKLFGTDSVGDKSSYEHKERMVFFFERLQALSNSLGICYFMHGLSSPDMLLPEDYAALYSAATGKQVNADRLMWMGERIFNLEKCFNVLHTEWERPDDGPPERFFSTFLDGKYKINRQAWEELLDRYYDLHGWDKETAKPLNPTLDRLDLLEIQEKLKKNNRF
jgi:aldehyde:ferredoxin oxidoreductase